MVIPNYPNMSCKNVKQYGYVQETKIVITAAREEIITATLGILVTVEIELRTSSEENITDPNRLYKGNKQ